MTGALMPEYWAEAELSPPRPKLRLGRWLLIHAASRAPAAAEEPDPQRPPAAGDTRAGSKGYLADIW